ncbi:hypothetical protein [Roseibium sp.]|uniref:hypothetical protein n=1 Tax=Roseibium sp. TaxID=1936156 RepID=UPI003BABAB0D
MQTKREPRTSTLRTAGTEDETVYVTLGPEGTNHDFVLRNYLRERGSRARVIHAPDATRMLEHCVRGDATHLMICAAHPAAAEIVATAQCTHGILLTDTFIATSQPLAILTRSAVEHPRTIALHPATRSYTSFEEFDEVIEVTSTVAALEGLLQGHWDSALTLRRYADAGDVKMVRPIDAARDAWLVLSRG